MLKGVKRKYPKIDLDELLNAVQPQSVYPKNPIKIPLAFGGALAGRSIVKSALCLAVSNGVDATKCESARRYLTDENAEACFGYYYERDLLLNRPARIPLHCLAVTNRQTRGQLLAYVEFFGIQRTIVCLPEQYDGAPLHCSYAVNPLSGEELNIDFEVPFSHEDIIATYAYDRIPVGSIEAAFDAMLPVALENAFEREKNRALSEAVSYAFKNCGAIEGQELTPEHLRTISDLIMRKLDPFLVHRLASPFDERREEPDVT